MQREHDVCFLLEGTYPFVSGGVSTWLHNLILQMPDIAFTAVCILPARDDKWRPKYEIPENFRDYEVIYIHEPIVDKPPPFRMPGRRIDADLLRCFHRAIRKEDFGMLPQVLEEADTGRLKMWDLLHSRESWDLFMEFCNIRENDWPLVDGFWTQRLTHLPMFKALTAPIPRAKVYHAISTGYAGLLGVLGHIRYGRPLLLTEHGIYFKERKIDISQSEWIGGNEKKSSLKGLNPMQEMWIRVFKSLSLLTYRHAARIFTLYEGNRQLEIEIGADPAKVEIVPNGIDIDAFARLKPEDAEPGSPPRIGFVGRVVQIKDVKTFIRAMKIVSDRLPGTKAFVMGPTEEDPEYFEECVRLTRLLEIEENLVFTGKIDVHERFPELDLIVLTSVSEAQPLVVLEANCAGIPAVVSDVGGCRELVEGRTEADRALGPSGRVTAIADPLDTAKAIIDILSRTALWKEMSQAGRRRVATFYRESDLVDRYRDVYQSHMTPGSEH